MTFWKVYTNEHPNGVYVHGNIGEKKIRKRMFEYIREKRVKGVPLRDIIYCRSRVSTGPLP